MGKKIPQNVEGRFYVDRNCINCSLCVEIAPDIFETNHDEGVEYVKQQPKNATEHKLMTEVINLCPANAIQDNKKAI